MSTQPKLGSGARFSRLENALAKKPGIKNPAAVAASIGREKYGTGRMAAMASAGRKRHSRMA